jgi:hypothetical protein
MDRQPYSKPIEQQFAVDTPLDLRQVGLSATAVIQHRRERERRYIWVVGEGAGPPLGELTGHGQTAPGEISVSGSSTLTLSVPGGTVGPGRWLCQLAVVVRDRPQRMVPTDPARLKLTEP